VTEKTLGFLATITTIWAN